MIVSKQARRMTPRNNRLNEISDGIINVIVQSRGRGEHREINEKERKLLINILLIPYQPLRWVELLLINKILGML